MNEPARARLPQAPSASDHGLIPQAASPSPVEDDPAGTAPETAGTDEEPDLGDEYEPL